MQTSIKSDAIAGHQHAINRLRQSIKDREAYVQSCKELIPSNLLMLNRFHLFEVAQLELLELELREMQR